MYNELYEIWKQELESAELKKLPPDFYSKIADYLKRLKEESRMLDKKSLKAILLKKEQRNVKQMIRELVQTRYRKLVKKMAEDERVPSNVLTIEEEKIYRKAFPFAEAYQNFAKNILQGQILKVSIEQRRKRAVLRFLTTIPAIIGVDMKTYGPFKVEDIASLPFENAKILIKERLAEKLNLGSSSYFSSVNK